jgi:hypothetical protein
LVSRRTGDPTKKARDGPSKPSNNAAVQRGAGTDDDGDGDGSPGHQPNALVTDTRDLRVGNWGSSDGDSDGSSYDDDLRGAAVRLDSVSRSGGADLHHDGLPQHTSGDGASATEDRGDPSVDLLVHFRQGGTEVLGDALREVHEAAFGGTVDGYQQHGLREPGLEAHVPESGMDSVASRTLPSSGAEHRGVGQPPGILFGTRTYSAYFGERERHERWTGDTPDSSGEAFESPPGILGSADCAVHSFGDDPQAAACGHGDELENQAQGLEVREDPQRGSGVLYVGHGQQGEVHGREHEDAAQVLGGPYRRLRGCIADGSDRSLLPRVQRG